MRTTLPATPLSSSRCLAARHASLANAGAAQLAPRRAALRHVRRRIVAVDEGKKEGLTKDTKQALREAIPKVPALRADLWENTIWSKQRKQGAAARASSASSNGKPAVGTAPAGATTAGALQGKKVPVAAPSREPPASVLSAALVALLKEANLNNPSGIDEDNREEVDELVAKLEDAGAAQTSPLQREELYGNYSVAYTSAGSGQRGAPAGGRFRGSIGRLLFKTKGLYQNVRKPKEVANLVCFALFGLVAGSVALRGKLEALEDGKSVRVQFEKPRLRVGPLTMSFGPTSQVELATTYLDDKVRLGKGSRGSTFVFVRGGNGADDVAPQVEQLYSARALGVASTLALAVTLLVGAFFLGMKLAPLVNAPSALGLPLGAAVVVLVCMLGAVFFNGGIVQGDQDKSIPQGA